jgi:hypothetical protein
VHSNHLRRSTGTVKDSRALYIGCGVISAVLVWFALLLWFMSAGLPSVRDLVKENFPNFRHSGLNVFVPDGLRNVKVSNEFQTDIAIFFEDGESGAFLTNLAPGEQTHLSAANGYGFYATEVNSWHTLSTIYVRSGVDVYSFHPRHNGDSTNNHHIARVEVTLGAEVRTRRHPAVRPLERHEQATHAMAAKFRSLSGRRINLWFEDGNGGTEQGHLNPGQETTTNTYEV